MVSLKKASFLSVFFSFLSHCHANIVGRSDSYLLTHTKKYMTPIHALICKNMSTCVFMQDMLKSRCKFVTLLGIRKYAQQKQVGWEVIFSELEFAGSGRVSLSGSSRAAPSTFFAACSEASGASIVLVKYY